MLAYAMISKSKHMVYFSSMTIEQCALGRIILRNDVPKVQKFIRFNFQFFRLFGDAVNHRTKLKFQGWNISIY